MKSIQNAVKQKKELKGTESTRRYVVTHRHDQREYIFKVIKTPTEKECNEIKEQIDIHQHSFEHHSKLIIRDLDIQSPYTGILYTKKSEVSLIEYLGKQKDQDFIDVGEAFFNLGEAVSNLYHYGLGTAIHINNVYIDENNKAYLDLVHPSSELDKNSIPNGERMSGKFLYRNLNKFYTEKVTPKSNMMQSYLLSGVGIGSQRSLLEYFAASNYNISDRNYDLNRFTEDLSGILGVKRENENRSKRRRSMTPSQIFIASFLVGGAVYFAYDHLQEALMRSKIEQTEKEIVRMKDVLYKNKITDGVSKEYKEFLYSSYLVMLDKEGKIIPIAKDAQSHIDKYKPFVALVEDIYDQKLLLLTNKPSEEGIKKFNETLTQLGESNGLSIENRLQLYQDFASLSEKIREHFVSEILKINITDHTLIENIPEAYKKDIGNWKIIDLESTELVSSLEPEYLIDDRKEMKYIIQNHYFANNFLYDAQGIEKIMKKVVKNHLLGTKSKSEIKNLNEKYKSETGFDYHAFITKEMGIDGSSAESIDEKEKKEYLVYDAVMTNIHKKYLEKFTEKLRAYEANQKDLGKIQELLKTGQEIKTLYFEKTYQMYSELIQSLPTYPSVHKNYIDVTRTLLNGNPEFGNEDNIKEELQKQQERYNNLYYSTLK